MTAAGAMLAQEERLRQEFRERVQADKDERDQLLRDHERILLVRELSGH